MPGLKARLMALLKLLTALVGLAYRTFGKVNLPLTSLEKFFSRAWAWIARAWISSLYRRDVDGRERHSGTDKLALSHLPDGSSASPVHVRSEGSSSEASGSACASTISVSPGRGADQVDQEPEDYNHEEEEEQMLTNDKEEPNDEETDEEEAMTDSDDDNYATSSSLSLIPVVPSEFEGHKFREFDNSVFLPEYILPLNCDYSSESLPGWTLHSNALGLSYFSSDHEHFTAYVTADLRRRHVEPWIQTYLRIIHRRIESSTTVRALFASHEVDLILDLRWSSDTDSDNAPSCGYYFAHRQHQTVFWLDLFENASKRILRGRSVMKYTLLHGLRRQYWIHCESFPHGRVPPMESLVELENYYRCWLRSSIATSSDPARDSQNEKRLQLIRHAIRLLTDGNNSAPISEIVELWETLFALLKAMEHSYLVRVPSAHAGAAKPAQSADSEISLPLHVRMMQVSMFYLPWGHSVAIRHVFRWGLPIALDWNAVCSKNLQDWRDLTLYSTLLLNANIAFLTVGSVDGLPDPSYVKIAAYISSIASFGSIFTGLMLVRNTHTVSNDLQVPYTATDVETLAIIYSLPYALLIWGSFAFVIAFSGMCMSQPGFVTRTFFGMFLTCVAALMLVMYMFIKEKRYDLFLRNHAYRLRTRIVDRWREFWADRKPKDSSAEGGNVNEEHEMRGQVEEGANVVREGEAEGAGEE